MCKSSTLGFVLVFAFFFKLERPTWRLVGIISLITLGVILMVSAETKFDLTGAAQVISASALGGLRWSLIQILLQRDKLGMDNPVVTLFWLAPAMGLTLAICSVAWEDWSAIFAREEFWGTFARTMTTVGAIVLPGFLAFCMNLSEFGCVLSLSLPLSLSLSLSVRFESAGPDLSLHTGSYRGRPSSRCR
jgi:solute carrier family 35 protein C2